MTAKPLHARRYLLVWIRLLNRWGQRFNRWGRALSGHAKRVTDKAVEDYKRGQA